MPHKHITNAMKPSLGQKPLGGEVKGKVYHVYYTGGCWEVLDRMGQPVSSPVMTQVDAVIHAKELARRDGGGQIIAHREDGTVASEFIYQPEERRSLERDDSVRSFAASKPERRKT